jgi:hypothetical protein
VTFEILYIYTVFISSTQAKVHLQLVSTGLGFDTAAMHTDQALFANDAFYLAFAARDIDHMDALWARKSPVICLHPGWPALTSRQKIIDSWQRILSNPQQKPIDVYNAQAHQLADAVAVVCYEELDGNVMVATNLYITEGERVVLAHHQAGPCGQPPPRA